MRPLAVLIATLLALGLVGACGGDDDSETEKAKPRAANIPPEQIADVSAHVRRIKRCFTQLGLKAPGNLRERREYDFQIEFPADLRGNRHVTTRTKARLRDCLATEAAVCTRSGRGGVDLSCVGPTETVEAYRSRSY